MKKKILEISVSNNLKTSKKIFYLENDSYKKYIHNYFINNFDKWISINDLIYELRINFNISKNLLSDNGMNVLIRNQIRKLRKNKVPIISKRGCGYKITNNVNEINDFIKTEIARINDLSETIFSIKESI